MHKWCHTGVGKCTGLSEQKTLKELREEILCHCNSKANSVQVGNATAINKLLFCAILIHKISYTRFCTNREMSFQGNDTYYVTCLIKTLDTVFASPLQDISQLNRFFPEIQCSIKGGIIIAIPSWQWYSAITQKETCLRWIQQSLLVALQSLLSSFQGLPRLIIEQFGLKVTSKDYLV